MITKTINYIDFEENEVKATFDFHLSKAEIAELNFLEDGRTLDEVLVTMSKDSTNIRTVMNLLKDILRAAVGKKSDDGKRFVKNDEVRSELFDTDAYSELLIEIMSDPKAAAEFITGVLPRDLRTEYKKTLGGKNLEDMSADELRQQLAEARAAKAATPEQS